MLDVLSGLAFLLIGLCVFLPLGGLAWTLLIWLWVTLGPGVLLILALGISAPLLWGGRRAS